MATYTPSTITNIALNGLDMMTVPTATAAMYKAFGFTALDSKWDNLTNLINHLNNMIITAKGNDELINVVIENGEYLPEAVATELKAVATKYKKNVKFTVSLLPNVDSKTPITVVY